MNAQPFPLRLDGQADFARVRSLLERARFDDTTLREELHLDSLARIGTISHEAIAAFAARNPTLGALVRLLVIGHPLALAEVEQCVDRDLLRSLLALDVLRRMPMPGVGGGADGFAASVMLYPVADLLIASDRHDHPDGSPFVAPPDVVFPAIFHGTLRFLRVIAKSPAEDALDLCSGTAIGALVLSQAVRHVVAADLTARSTHFARFNVMLNDCRGVEVVQGDLYEPVRGRQFDRIVAHPPYVPALSESQIFRDAGDTGESILQRIIVELPPYLRPGGTLYCVAAGWDTAEGPLEARIRRWLGDASSAFDLILAHDEELSPEIVARRLADKSLGGDARADALQRFEQRFATASLERSVYGAIVLRRRPGGDGREPFTLRCRLSERTDGAAFEWALGWHRWRVARAAAGELDRELLGSTLRLGADLQVKTLHVVDDGRLAQDSIVLESDRPFLSSTKVEPWMVGLVAEFGDGRKADDVYARAREQGSLPEGFELSDFAALVAAMVERGYLAEK